MVVGIIFIILFVVFILMVYKNCGRDFEKEEREKREEYYDRILNRNKNKA